jgi:hypothetical protein
MQADNHGLPDQWRLCRLRHDYCAFNGASNFQAYPPLLIQPLKAALEARVFKRERFTRRKEMAFADQLRSAVPSDKERIDATCKHYAVRDHQS